MRLFLQSQSQSTLARETETQTKKKAMSSGGEPEAARYGTCVVGTPVEPRGHPANQHAATWVAGEARPAGSHSSYLNATPSGSASGFANLNQSGGENPYVHVAPANGSAPSGRRPMNKICDALNRLKRGPSVREPNDCSRKAWVSVSMHKFDDVVRNTRSIALIEMKTDLDGVQLEVELQPENPKIADTSEVIDTDGACSESEPIEPTVAVTADIDKESTAMCIYARGWRMRFLRREFFASCAPCLMDMQRHLRDTYVMDDFLSYMKSKDNSSIEAG